MAVPIELVDPIPAEVVVPVRATRLSTLPSISGRILNADGTSCRRGFLSLVPVGVESVEESLSEAWLFMSEGKFVLRASETGRYDLVLTSDRDGGRVLGRWTADTGQEGLVFRLPR